MYSYHNDTEPLYHSFMYSLVSGIYSLPAMHSLLVTLYVTEYFICNGMFNRHLPEVNLGATMSHFESS